MISLDTDTRLLLARERFNHLCQVQVVAFPQEGILRDPGAADLLEEGGAFLVLSCYAVGTSPLAFHNLLGQLGAGTVEAGELAIPQQDGTRLLPAGLCGRWSRQ